MLLRFLKSFLGRLDIVLWKLVLVVLDGFLGAVNYRIELIFNINFFTPFFIRVGIGLSVFDHFIDVVFA